MKNFNIKQFTFILIGLNLIFFIAITYYPKLENSNNVSAEQRDIFLNIMTTNKLTYSMVKGIVKDKHNVTYMFKNENEVLNYKSTNNALDNISNMDLFIYMGAEAEPWINNFISDLKKDKVGLINASRGIKIINYEGPIKINGYDIKSNPNYYLSPDDLKISLYNVKNAVQEKDPKNRDWYEQNYELEIEKFDESLETLYKKIDILNTQNVYSVGDDLSYLMRYLSQNPNRIPKEDLDKKIEEIKTQTSDQNKDNAALKEQNLKGNVVFFSDETEYKKYEDKFKEIGFSSLLIKKPVTIEDYKEYLKSVSDFINSLNINKKANG